MRVPAERPVSLEADLAGVPALCIESAPGLRVSEAVLEQIGAIHLDFILHFGVGLVEEALLRAARYGVWFYLHGQAPSFGSAAPGYAEICAGEPVTMASLRRWVAPECSIVLREGCFKALHHAYARGLNALLAGSACWPAQVCTDILNGNADYLEDAPPAPNPPIRPSPGNLDGGLSAPAGKERRGLALESLAPRAVEHRHRGGAHPGVPDAGRKACGPLAG